jgi:leucyl-tRNA synthetase
MSHSNSYNFQEIEAKWQKNWTENQLYTVDIDTNKPKYYVLDMFPYPSGAGLHVGHPLGYIASDIVSRFKRLNGFNVLHPMGYDAFGLPAEQYAIQTGQHPAITTEQNVKRFREQLDKIGFSYDWSREVKTCDPNYYKWTQYIFSLFFTHYYDKQENKARTIGQLISEFQNSGNKNIIAHSPYSGTFSAEDWNQFNPTQKEEILNHYRLAFIDETTVNWCQELGTVLANEEVVNGVSERGGYPVIRKKMKQWSLRITAYADRLIEGLNHLEWSDSLKEIQRNWIGKSEGAEVDFWVPNLNNSIRIFTTRPDTIFGATYMVIAPEFENLDSFCTADQLNTVVEYANKAKNRSEIERMADTTKTGVFTGAYAINPFTNTEIPIWVSDYVLAGYGTGAIMAVPAHDDRDFEFAKAFNLPIIPVIKPENADLTLPLEEAFISKDGVCFNSDFLNGLNVKAAVKKAIEEIQSRNIGTKKINYKLREAGFGRQRYWGEPFPIVYNQDGVPNLINELPVELPKVESYKPSGTGESPLAAVTDWVNTSEGTRETDTMPGWAGSSWYFLRYIDPKNPAMIASPDALEYWNQVDLYIGGSEHATGHLLYSRFWTKFLHDLNFISWDEPFKKLVNQGMIMGEDGQKMSKRWGNVVNPDDVCAQYGADTLRLYEMFLGPLTDSKPWNTHGIEGVSRFIAKLWRLFFEGESWAVNNESSSPEELKILHKTIKKITQDIETMSFNTSVSAFMVCVNELTTIKCRKKDILEPLLVLLAPFAPHVSEELWKQLGNENSIHIGNWPVFNESFVSESTFNYPISINGKTRTQLEFPIDAETADIEKAVLENEIVQKWLEGKAPKKIIVVKNRIVNVVM